MTKKQTPAKQTAASTPDSSTSSSASTSTSSAAVGDVISYQLEDDGPTINGIVVGRIDSDKDRDAALQVVALPDSIVVPLDAVKG